ncbi:hypothetical protein [Streptosporangium vulgare]|uniref:hypothetical protein n=1 Tax=Streptosporangium vulgare TaxID=46190 RepID=UPI0031DDD818
MAVVRELRWLLPRPPGTTRSASFVGLPGCGLVLPSFRRTLPSSDADHVARLRTSQRAAASCQGVATVTVRQTLHTVSALGLTPAHGANP